MLPGPRAADHVERTDGLTAPFLASDYIDRRERPSTDHRVTTPPVLGVISILSAGFLLGLRHATDPDHVIAVTTIVSRKQSLRSASTVGAAWGIGHTLTILVVGGAIVLFRLTIPARVEMALEMGVAAMLIALGIMTLRGTPRSTAERSRPLLVGIVHGLAGSAAVGLLVATLIDSAVTAIAYLLVFGLGSITGMIAMTAAIALPSMFAARRVAGASRYLRLASGGLSIAFGAFLVQRIGFAGGLFTSGW